MSLLLKRLLILVAIGGLLAVSGCDSNSYYGDNPYGDRSYDGYRSSSRDSAYDRGYRDGERSSFSQHDSSRDYEKGYERGQREARQNEARREARERERNRDRDRDEYRQSRDHRPPRVYPAPGDYRQPGEPKPAPGTFGINDG